MSAIHEAYINALLADATYALEQDGLEGKAGAGLIELLSTRMTPTLATYVGENFTVLTHIESSDNNPFGSGFDATVWRDSNGKTYVSMQGTQGVEDFLADLDLTTFGAAVTQIESMVNWWLKNATPLGQVAKQISLNPLTYNFSLATSVSGTGILSDISNLTINGHSLGGHLATAFTRLFGGQAGWSIDHTYTYNSAGFTASSEGIFKQIEALLGTGVSKGYFEGLVGQSNYFAENGVNATTRTFLNGQAGLRTALFNEESGFPISNHYMYKLTDALALGDAIARLDNTFDTAKMSALFDKGANQTEASLEGILDSLRKTLLGSSVAPTPIGDSGDSPNTRIAYYNNLKALTDSASYQSLINHVTFSSTIPDISEVRTDLGAFLSLYYLTPFTLKIDGSAEAITALGAAHPDLESKWQEDKLLTSDQRAIGEANFSDLYLADRAAMLSWINKLNTEDFVDPNNGFGYVMTNAAAQHFEDKDTGQIIDVNKISNAKRYFIFGSDVKSDALTGGTQNDHLYGMGGVDILDGGNGNDWLEGGTGADILNGGEGDDVLLGGAGNDTLEGGSGNDQLKGGAGDDVLSGGTGNDIYIFNASGNGHDRIVDSDNQGSIIYHKFNDVTQQSVDIAINGLFSLAGNIWEHTMTDGSKVVLSHNSTWVLTLPDGGSVDLGSNFKNGDFGIGLENLETTELSIVFPTLVGVNGYIGTGTGLDEYILPTATFVEQPLGSFYLNIKSYGLGGDDLLEGGASIPNQIANYIANGNTAAASIALQGDDDSNLAYGNDRIYALAKIDLAEAIEKGNLSVIEEDVLITSVLDGGRGDDVLVGDIGADYLTGGLGQDILIGGSSSDILLGDSVNQGLWWDGGSKELRGLDQIPENMGDILYGGSGDDNLDGQLGNDFLDGGPGDDFLQGGEESDVIYGGDGNDYLRDDLYFYRQWSEIKRPYLKNWNDLLDGGAGDDRIDIYCGNNTIIGGLGHDVIDLFSDLAYFPTDYQREDLLIFNRGDGDDTVYATNTELTVRFNNINSDSLTLSTLNLDNVNNPNAGQSLKISYGLTDSITFKYAYSWQSIKQIEFGDGTTLTLQELMQSKLQTPINWTGTANADVITGGLANDTLTGGGGDDVLQGGAGDDIYIFNLGDGVDHIQDGEGNNILQFGTGITPEMLSLGLGSLLIRIGSGGEAIHLDNFDPANAQQGTSVTTFRFENGTEWNYADLLRLGFDINGTDDADTFIGTSVDDIFNGLAGNDIFYGGTGSDSYRFNIGDGADTIYETVNDTDTAADKILLGAGITPADITVTRSNNDLVLKFATANDQIMINNWYSSSACYIEQLVFADGTVWDAAAINQQANSLPAGEVIITGNTIQNQTLTVSNSITDTDGIGVIGYQWQTSFNGAQWNNISGAIADTLVLTQNQVDLKIRVLASYIDGYGKVETVTSNPTSVVSNVNDAPMLTSSQAALADGTADTAYSVTMAQLLQGYTDADGDSLSITALSADHGTITMNEDNSYTIAPTAHYIGTVTLSYTVTDGHSGNASATLDFNLDAPPTITYTGDETDNTLTGSAGNDILNGLGGRDTLIGGNGNDILNGGAGADRMQGGLGDDTYVVDDANDIVMEDVDGGIDTVQVTIPVQTWLPSNTVYTLGANVEHGMVIAPTEPPPIIVTATGATTVAGSLYGNALDNTLHGAATISNYLYGNAGNDSLYGGDYQDMLVGGNGDDYIDGGAGSDNIAYHTASSGVTINLSITGPQNTQGAGVDTLLNVENIIGSSYSDHLTGNAANNRFQSFGGNDVIDGGDGAFDLIEFTNVLAAVNVNMTGWTIQSTNMQRIGNLTLSNIEGVSGSIYNDTLTGSSGADYLNGYAGNDIVNGGDGDDYLAGGSGTDVLTGGLGKDTFILSSDRGLGLLNAADTITDFTLTDDVFQLVNADFKALIGMNGTLASNYFVVGVDQTTANDADDYIIYNSTNGNVFYDADGSGSAYSSILIADVSDGLALTHGNFKVSNSVLAV